MTRKRIRYSELAQPPVAPPSDAAAPEIPPVEPAPLIDQGLVIDSEAEPLELIAAPFESSGEMIEPDRDVFAQEPAASEPPIAPPSAAELPSPRPRRNSTPVELARTLSAERAAAQAQNGDAPWVDPLDAAPIVEEPKRSLREMARRREGMAEMLMFRVGGERFAVELVLVDEVIDLPVIHHVPEMPPAMFGVVTVRGSLTPVYSPRQALGLPLALRDALLIFRRGAHRVGILIDDVDDATSIDMSELRETIGGDQPDSVLLGVVRLASALVGIVDADALIAACQSADILETA